MRKLFQLLLTICLLSVVQPAHADSDLQTQQVGTVIQGGMGYYVYSYLLFNGYDEQCGAGVVRYSKEFLNLSQGVSIKKLQFLGYSNYNTNAYNSIELWIANAPDNISDVAGFLNDANTGADTSKMTQFANLTNYSIGKVGSYTDPSAVVLELINDDGFVYDGGDLIIYAVAKSSNYNHNIKFAASKVEAGLDNSASGCKYKCGSSSAFDAKTLSDCANYYGVPVMVVGYETPTSSASLTGTVYDNSNNDPIEGVEVTLGSGESKQSYTTLADGKYSFTLSEVNLNTPVPLTATLDGYKPYEQTVEFTEDNLNQEININLEPYMPSSYTGVVNVTVKNVVTQALLNGATISLKVDKDEYTATVAEEGTYSVEVPNVILDKPYSLTVSMPGYHSYTSEIIFTESTQSFTENVELSYGVTITGTVTGNGSPLAGAIVSVGDIEDTTNDEGKYNLVIDNVDSASQTVKVACAGYAKDSKEIDTSVPAEITANFVLIEKAEPVIIKKQVGTIASEFTQGNLPFSTDYACGAGVTLYRKNAINIEKSNIYEIEFYGYSTGTNYDSIEIWLANEPETTTNVNAYISSDNKSVVTEKMTHFATIAPFQIESVGSYTSPFSAILKFENEDGFEYEGENLVVYVVARGTSNYFGMKFASCSEKTSDYTAENCKIKRNNAGAFDGTTFETIISGTGSANFVPVLGIGYAESSAPVYNASVTGCVKNKVTGNGIDNANVTVKKGVFSTSATTDSNGNYSIEVTDPDYDEEYTVAVSAINYNSNSATVSFSAGDLDKTADVSLTYGITVSGVVMKSTQSAARSYESVPAEGATVSCGDFSTTTDEDGKYTLEINPVTAADLTLTISMTDYQTVSKVIDASAPGAVLDNTDVTIVPTGISLVIDDMEEGTEVYTLNGIRVTEGKLLPGLYIIRKSNGATSKVAVK